MRGPARHSFTLVAAALVLGLAMPSAQAATPVLDGKKVVKLYTVQEAPPGAAAVDPTPAQVAACKPPACGRLPFVYKPAKGVKASLSVISRNFWAGLGNDDLYLMKGSQVIASCTGALSNKRYLSVPASKLKSGTTYTAVLFFSHEIGESTSIEVRLPGVAAPKAQDINPDKPFDYAITMCGV